MRDLSNNLTLLRGKGGQPKSGTIDEVKLQGMPIKPGESQADFASYDYSASGHLHALDQNKVLPKNGIGHFWSAS